MGTIEHLEYLSKLKFSDDEKTKFASEFDDILKFVDEISKLDLPGDFDKDRSVKLSDLRDDEPTSSMSREEVLANAPKKKDGCFVTPLVVE